VNQSVDAVLLLDSAGRIVMVSDPARDLLDIGNDLIGKNLLGLEEKYRPEPLRLMLEDVRPTSRIVRLEDLTFQPPEGESVSCGGMSVRSWIQAAA
jgi:PAS domain-containing protein